MDLAQIKTTDDLLLVLPPAEDDKWEFKSAKKLTDVDIDAELGKQVSAFANTGGGNLVFGIADKTRQIEPCIKKIGRQPTMDWLVTKVQNSVSYSLQDFKVYEIPISGNAGESIFIVEIGDSQTAPHQAKTTPPVYYWRLYGKSEPAPHFHLDLLRSRLTSVILEVVSIDCTIEAPMLNAIDEEMQRHSELEALLTIWVKNTSKRSAESWGARFIPNSERVYWRYQQPAPSLEEAYLRSPPEQLLPGQTSPLHVTLRATVRNRGNVEQHNDYISKTFDGLQFTFQPVSHNHFGEEVAFGPGQSGEWNRNLSEDLIWQLRKVARTKEDGTLERMFPAFE